MRCLAFEELCVEFPNETTSRVLVRTSQQGFGDGTRYHLFGLLLRFGYDIRCLECFQPVRIYSASSFGTTIILGIVHVRGVSSIHSLHMNHLLHHLEQTTQIYSARRVLSTSLGNGKLFVDLGIRVRLSILDTSAV